MTTHERIAMPPALSLSMMEVDFLRTLIKDLSVDGIDAYALGHAVVQMRDHVRKLSSTPFNDPDMMRVALKAREAEIVVLREEVETLKSSILNIEKMILKQDIEYGRF